MALDKREMVRKTQEAIAKCDQVAAEARNNRLRFEGYLGCLQDLIAAEDADANAAPIKTNPPENGNAEPAA